MFYLAIAAAIVAALLAFIIGMRKWACNNVRQYFR